MTLETYKRIVDAGTILIGLALLLCLYKFPKRSLEVKYQSIGFLANVLAMVYVEVAKPHGMQINIPMSAIMLPISISPLLMFDAAWKGRYRTMTIVSIILLCTFGLWNAIYGQGIEMNTNTHTAGSIVIMLYCVLYYYYLLTELPVQRLERLPMFWFTAGYLTYHGGGLFIFAAYVVDLFRDSLFLYWTIQNFLRIAQLIIIIVGLWLDIRNVRLSSSSQSVH